MSTTTMTPAQAPKKKNVACRLFALLLLLGCVGLFFLPIGTFTDLFTVSKQSLFTSLKALIKSDNKMFKLLPMLVVDAGVVSKFATATLYMFVLSLVIAFVMCFIALFTSKAPSIVRGALFLLAWGAFLYALTVYALTAATTEKAKIDLITTALAVGFALIFFFFVLGKNGASAWLNGLHYLFALAVTMLVTLAVVKNGLEVALAMETKAMHKYLVYAVVFLLDFTLFIASCRMFSKKGSPVADLIRAIFQILFVLLAIGVCFLAKLTAGNFLLYALIAAGVALTQIIILSAQVATMNKVDPNAIRMAALAEFEAGFNTEEVIEAYPYEGGPVAGVLMAEEVNPTSASVDAENDPAAAARVNAASLLGNGFDPFLIQLSEKEKADFVDIYVLKCKGLMPEIPGYVVGGDNKDFFNKVFIYLGQYREKIPAGLLSKMYDYSMKL